MKYIKHVLAMRNHPISILYFSSFSEQIILNKLNKLKIAKKIHFERQRVGSLITLQGFKNVNLKPDIKMI